MCVKSCSPLREWKVSLSLGKQFFFVNCSDPLNSLFSPAGSLEDWDVAVQKTETRLNRINEQRAKVGAHVRTEPVRCICWLLSAYVTTRCPSVRWLRRRPTWLAKRRTKPSSGGRPSQTRRLRRSSSREVEWGRRGKRNRMIIKMSGMRIRVR